MTREAIAENIKNVTRQKGLIQRAVAERAGFTEQQFTDMLKGRKIIRIEYAPAISAALGVTLNDLFDVGQDSK